MNGLDDLLKKTGRHYIAFERFLFKTAEKFSPDYDGGCWKDKKIDEKDSYFYVELDDNKEYNIRETQNYYDAGAMDSKTFSLSIWTYSLNLFGNYLYSLNEDGVADIFFQLYYYVLDNQEIILGMSKDNEENAPLTQFNAFLD